MASDNVLIPEEYNDLLYRVTYAALGKVAPLIPAAISHNQITFAAFVFAVTGCALLYFVTTPVAYLYWALFNFIWYLLDALDGIHARRTGQTSEYGGYLDHALDNIFFIFMFAAFAVKFDLLHPLYMLAIIIRMTSATVVFIAQVHTGKLYLGKFSGGAELTLMTAVMFLSYSFPHANFIASANHPVLLHWAKWLSLDQGVFMKLALLVYVIGGPISMLTTSLVVKRQLCSSPNKQ